MTPAVLARRIAGHHLADNGLPTAADVVRSLTCVQSQEWAHAFWSLGQRTRGLTYDQVRVEFDGGDFVRTHILRPTWHFVAAADLRWIQAVTAPRVQQLNGTMYRREGLAPADLDRAATMIGSELAGGAALTRAELGRVLGAEGIRLVYLIMNAELEGVICSGPIRGAQHTYVLVDERIHDHHCGDATELAYRFFAGHGPASVKDLARWSSLTVTQSQEATEGAADRLESEVVDGTTLYSAATAGPSKGDDHEPRAFLLPLYDELTLSYPDDQLPVGRGPPAPGGRRPLRRAGDHRRRGRRDLAAYGAGPPGGRRAEARPRCDRRPASSRGGSGATAGRLPRP